MSKQQQRQQLLAYKHTCNYISVVFVLLALASNHVLCFSLTTMVTTSRSSCRLNWSWLPTTCTQQQRLTPSTTTISTSTAVASSIRLDHEGKPMISSTSASSSSSSLSSRSFTKKLQKTQHNRRTFVPRLPEFRILPTNNDNRISIWLERIQQRWMEVVSQKQHHQQQQQKQKQHAKNQELPLSVYEAATSYGMPWKKSICPVHASSISSCSVENSSSLLYMTFYEAQIAYMMENLTNLRPVPCISRSGQDMGYKETGSDNIDNTDNNNNNNGDNTKEQKMRIHTVCFQSDEYKLIRLTTLDAGYKTQVFTSLWYPNPDVRLPLLGIDLLQFNGKKHLCICDFQPIEKANELHHDDDTGSSMLYEHLLKPIRDKYKSLQGIMTNRFYNVNDIYFSNNMLLGRYTIDDNDNNNNENTSSTSTDFVTKELFPAIQSYMKIHVDLVKEQMKKQQQQQQQQQQEEQEKKHKIQQEQVQVQPERPSVLELHAMYDTYSAARDPAHGLLAKMFGKEWADEYVYDILFPSSNKDIQ